MRQEEWERESVGVKKRPLTLTLCPKGQREHAREVKWGEGEMVLRRMTG